MSVEEGAAVRYYDFDFVAEYWAPFPQDASFRYSYLGHSEHGAAYQINLIRLSYRGSQWVETDTLSASLSSTQLDRLFALSVRFFDLAGSENVAPHSTPPPPPVYDGYNVDLTLDLGYRGRFYATRFPLLDRPGAPSTDLDEYLRSLIPLE